MKVLMSGEVERYRFQILQPENRNDLLAAQSELGTVAAPRRLLRLVELLEDPYPVTLLPSQVGYTLANSHLAPTREDETAVVQRAKTLSEQIKFSSTTEQLVFPPGSLGDFLTEGGLFLHYERSSFILQEWSLDLDKAIAPTIERLVSMISSISDVMLP